MVDEAVILEAGRRLAAATPHARGSDDTARRPRR
jgi:hypothetical protein